MVVEQVELTIAAGKEEDCLKYLAETRSVIESSKGFHFYAFGRGVENPSKVMLAVGWDSVEAHEAAKQRAEFVQFSTGLRGFVTGASAQHFAIAS
jgi:quinol monooxygenase YgiN